jgi:hypothetical protein
MLKAGSYGKGQLFPTERGTPQGGVVTPLTQKVIWAFWLRAAVLRRTRRNRDAVTNGDGIFTDQNFFNQEWRCDWNIRRADCQSSSPST